MRLTYICKCEKHYEFERCTCCYPLSKFLLLYFHIPNEKLEMRKYVFELIFIHRDKWHFESQAMKVFIYCYSHFDFLPVGSCLEQSKTNGCTDNCSAISLGEEQTSSPTADSTEGEHRTYENLCRLSPLQHQWRYAQGYIWTFWQSESNFEFHTPRNRSRDMCSLSLSLIVFVRQHEFWKYVFIVAFVTCGVFF